MLGTERYTGKSVDKVVRDDVVTLIRDIASGNIRYISPLELIDVKRMLPLLAECYPDEVNLGYKMARKAPLNSK